MDSHDRYRHLRANLESNRALTGYRTVKVFCDVCQIFEPDESGLCPLCQPDPPRDLHHPGKPWGGGESGGHPLQPGAREDGAA